MPRRSLTGKPDAMAPRDRGPHYKAVALRTLASLAGGDRRTRTLHLLRTHLRRLQAFLELVGEEDNAEVIAGCVGRLSRLRELQVFEGYLQRIDAPKRDRRKVAERLDALHAKTLGKHVYRKIQAAVKHHALPPVPTTKDWMAARMATLRRRNAEKLRQLIARAEASPRRKVLHELRLTIKTIRYQEEWVLGRPFARPEVIAWLKQAQSVLGAYEDLAAFRKLAAKWALRSGDRIKKDWRRARKKARAVPAGLHAQLDHLAGRRLRLVPARRLPDKPAVAV
jgi:CHAD domain-containing protein